MLGLIQLVSHAEVKVAQQTIGAIDRGILALIGIEKTDTHKEAERLIDRILHYRIFPDADGRMNVDLVTLKGGLLLVPQFTLVADTSKGTRPGFSTGMPPEEGRAMFAYLVDFASKNYPFTAVGEFGANMQVSLCNDGPVTFMLRTGNPM